MRVENVAAAGTLSRSAADVYQDFFVPALFGEWGERVCAQAGVAPSHRVLDVACGTGVAARAAAGIVDATGLVTGVDRNAAMLAVAQRASPALAWQTARAEALPFGDAAFDAVLCQFGLMFFDDRAAGLREMARVLRPGGRLALAVWADVAVSPGYRAMVDLLEDLFGADTAAALRAPFAIGTPAALMAEFAQAGLAPPKITAQTGRARFASIRDWVHTDIKGWTLADRIDAAQYAHLQAEAAVRLAHLADDQGRVSFAAPALIAVWEKS
ncbi:MAG: methyltransferase domain-containing protein [Pseudomonadota bacterium]